MSTGLVPGGGNTTSKKFRKLRDVVDRAVNSDTQIVQKLRIQQQHRLQQEHHQQQPQSFQSVANAAILQHFLSPSSSSKIATTSSSSTSVPVSTIPRLPLIAPHTTLSSSSSSSSQQQQSQQQKLICDRIEEIDPDSQLGETSFNFANHFNVVEVEDGEGGRKSRNNNNNNSGRESATGITSRARSFVSWTAQTKLSRNNSFMDRNNSNKASRSETPAEGAGGGGSVIREGEEEHGGEEGHKGFLSLLTSAHKLDTTNTARRRDSTSSIISNLKIEELHKKGEHQEKEKQEESSSPPASPLRAPLGFTGFRTLEQRKQHLKDQQMTAEEIQDKILDEEEATLRQHLNDLKKLQEKKRQSEEQEEKEEEEEENDNHEGGGGGGGRENKQKNKKKSSHKKFSDSRLLQSEHRCKLNEIASKTLRLLDFPREAREFDIDSLRAKQLDSVQYDEVHFNEMQELIPAAASVAQLYNSKKLTDQQRQLLAAVVSSSSSSSSCPTHILFEQLMHQQVSRKVVEQKRFTKTTASSSSYAKEKQQDRQLKREQKLEEQRKREEQQGELEEEEQKEDDNNNNQTRRESIATEVSASTTMIIPSPPRTRNPSITSTNTALTTVAKKSLQQQQQQQRQRLPPCPIETSIHSAFGEKPPSFNIRPSFKSGPPSSLVEGSDPRLIDALAMARFGGSAPTGTHNNNPASSSSAVLPTSSSSSSSSSTFTPPRPPRSTSQALSHRTATTTVRSRSPFDGGEEEEDTDRKLVAVQLKTLFDAKILNAHTRNQRKHRKFMEIEHGKKVKHFGKKNSSKTKKRSSSSCRNKKNNQEEASGSDEEEEEEEDAAEAGEGGEEDEDDLELRSRRRQENLMSEAYVTSILQEVDQSISESAVLQEQALQASRRALRDQEDGIEIEISEEELRAKKMERDKLMRQRNSAHVEKLLKTKEPRLFDELVLGSENDFVNNGGLTVPPEVIERQQRLAKQDARTAGIERGAILREMLRNPENTSNSILAGSSSSSVENAGADLRRKQDELQWKQSYSRGIALADQKEMLAKITARNLRLTSIGVPCTSEELISQRKQKEEEEEEEGENDGQEENQEEEEIEQEAGGGKKKPRNKILRSSDEDALITHRMHQQWQTQDQRHFRGKAERHPLHLIEMKEESEIDKYKSRLEREQAEEEEEKELKRKKKEAEEHEGEQEEDMKA